MVIRFFDRFSSVANELVIHWVAANGADYFAITGKDGRYSYFAFHSEKFHSGTQQFSLRRAIRWYYLPEKKLLRASFSRGFLLWVKNGDAAHYREQVAA